MVEKMRERNRRTDGRTLRVRERDKRGFSLIEVLITIFILGTVCITLVSVFIYGFNLLQKTKKVAMATEIAQGEVERYRNTPYATIQALAVGTPLPLSTESQALLGTSEYFMNGQGSATFEAVPGGDENIRKLTVQIRWIYRSRQQEKNVVTYIASTGINREN